MVTVLHISFMLFVGNQSVGFTHLEFQLFL